MMKTRSFKAALAWTLPLAVAVALAPLTLQASPAEEATTQEASKPQAQFEEDVQVTEVLLDVLVHDKRGNVIIGLDKDDFIVKEGKEQIPLESLTFYSNRLLDTSPEELIERGVELDDVPRDRYFILLFEDQKRRASEITGLLRQQLNAAKETKRWISSEIQPGDWIAVASYDYKLKLHLDFTQDRKALVEAVDRAMKGKDPGNWPSRLTEAEDVPSLSQTLPQGKVLGKKSKTIYDALQVLSDAAGEVPGRKNLLFFTLGFGDIDSFGQYRPDSRYYPPTMQALNDNNVAVYAIDLIPTGSRHTMADAMNHLALDTGGEYLFNFTSFMTPLRRAAEANSGYYLLGYSGRHNADASGFQEVTVSTKNPEFKIQARTGYSYGDES